MKHIFLLLLLSSSVSVFSQDWGPRTLDELKVETLRRAERGEGPIGDVIYADAERAMSNLQTLGRDDWAAVWIELGEEYYTKAEASEATNPEAARENFYYAWRYFDVGRWPTEKHSPGKRYSYERGLDAFRRYGSLLNPIVETIRIPFEGSEIIAYIRVPDTENLPPIVFGMNGLDSRKEGVMNGSQNYINNGVAAFAIDMPGTGQAPLLIDIGSERMLSAAIDYLETRDDIDSSRIVVQGRSWSGYWAAVLAYTERERILGSAVHGVGIHHYYQPEWQQVAINSQEYLFDLFPARSVVYDVDNMEDFLSYGPRLSLIDRGLINQPSAPMFLVNGHQDTQQPIEDLYLMMRSGDPKEAWVNPVGGHMGRSEDWSGGRIQREIVQPWVMRRLGVYPE
jgi:esterase FrsA